MVEVLASGFKSKLEVAVTGLHRVSEGILTHKNTNYFWELFFIDEYEGSPHIPDKHLNTYVNSGYYDLQTRRMEREDVSPIIKEWVPTELTLPDVLKGISMQAQFPTLAERDTD